MQHDPSSIAQNFQNHSDHHGSHIAPGLVLDAEKDIGNNEDSEERYQEVITSNAGQVVEGGLSVTACLQRANRPIRFDVPVTAGVRIDGHLETVILVRGRSYSDEQARQANRYST